METLRFVVNQRVSESVTSPVIISVTIAELPAGMKTQTTD